MLIKVPKAYLEDRRYEIMGDLKLKASSERRNVRCAHGVVAQGLLRSLFTIG
jgi:hypothetical protein